MSRRGTRNDGWVRIFEVPCFEKHEKGYTVYKIVSRVFPCQCPEASTQVTVWKRFSEFSRLHKEMTSLHAALYLKGTFPPLAKASFFNRFDTAVMEDRRAEIRATLEFVALHPPLFTSAPFTRFFEDGDCRTVNELDNLRPALSPQPSLTDSDVGTPTSSDVILPTASDVTPATTGDVIPPTAGDDPPPVVGALMGLDPLLPPELPAAGGSTNLQLLSEPPQPDLLSHLNSAPSPPSEEPGLDSISDSGGHLPDLSCSEEGVGTGAAAAGLSGLTLDGAADPPELPSPPSECGTPPAAAAAAEPALPPPGPAAPREAAELAPDAGRYLLTAADAISSAQEAESQCLWNLAFSHYQDGIGTLINGVQGDPSAERREAVRRKTAMYIGRAEQLAALCRDTPLQPRRRRLSHLCVEGGRPLGRYKVVGVTASGHLKVTDRESDAGQLYLIKVVVKCACSPDSPHDDTVLPERVPHMVQLHRLVETETAYYLVLQYLPRGRLWDSLADLSSFESSPSPPAAAAAFPSAVPPAAPLEPSEPSSAPPEPPEPLSAPPEPLSSPPEPSSAPPEPPSESPARGEAERTDGPAEPPPAADAMSSSYLQLFEDFAASVRRSGSVSLARNLSCPGPEPEPEPEPCLDQEPQSEPPGESDRGSGWCASPERDGEGELLSGAADGESVAEPPAAAAVADSDGSPDCLLSRSQQLLSAVERTLQVTSRRQRESPLPPPPPADTRHFSEGRDAAAADRDSPPEPVTLVTPVTASDAASSDGSRTVSGHSDAAVPSRESDADGAVCLPADGAASPRRQRLRTLDEDWWRRDGGDEQPPLQPPPPQLEPPPAADRHWPSWERVRLWTAQVVSALDRLHQQGIVYSNLRPENVLLTEDGDACLTYSCRLRAAAGRRARPASRRRQYTAPELTAPGRPASPAADWWSVGALLWELHGEGPLWRRHPAGLAEHTALRLPTAALPAARQLLSELLRPDPERRPVASQIRQHAYFTGLDWSRL